MLCFLHSELVTRPVNTVHNITFQPIGLKWLAEKSESCSLSFPGVSYKGGILKNAI